MAFGSIARLHRKLTNINELREVARAVCADPNSTGLERRQGIQPFEEAADEAFSRQGPSDRGNPDAEALLRGDLFRFKRAAEQKEAEEERDDPSFVESTPDDLVYLERSKRGA